MNTNKENEVNKNYFGVKHYNVKIVKEKLSPIRFIINVISYAVFMWLILIGITLLVYIADTKIRAAKGDFTPPKYNAYVVLTGSMIPEILPNDVVITKKTEGAKLKVGDIITFIPSDSRISNIIVTHRILNKYYDATTKKYTYQTKGDNNNTADFTLAEDQNVIGRVIFKIPKVGYIQTLLATRGGIIIAILIPALVILSYDIMKLGRNIMRNKKKSKTKIVRGWYNV